MNSQAWQPQCDPDSSFHVGRAAAAEAAAFDVHWNCQAFQPVGALHYSTMCHSPPSEREHPPPPARVYIFAVMSDR